MKYIKLVLICIFISGCSFISENSANFLDGKALSSLIPTQSNPKMSDEGILRKTSFHLRGFPAAASEYQELAKAKANGNLEAFMTNKRREYLSSAEYAEKMRLRILDLFKLRAPDRFVVVPDLADPQYSQFSANSFDFAAVEVAQKNESWDQLLLKKNYRVFPADPQRRFLNAGDGFFYQNVKPEVRPALGLTKPVDIVFDPSDSRIAGLITTPRFFARYVNTNLNKNRKRAAQIFKAFLCDDMRAVSLNQEGRESEIVKLVFPESGDPHESSTEEQIRKVLAGPDQHGNDPACIKCHEKLDPMGRTLLASPVVLSPRASAGRLFYRRLAGSVVDIPVSGLGELAEEITKTPEYAECQVKNFWNWFIGQDIALAPDRLDYLVKEFNRVGRRTQEFTEVLISQPEFRLSAVESPSEKLAREVKTLVGACSKCHRENVDSKHLPEFANWPIGGNMKRWIAKIEKAIDLRGDGSKADMPPTGTWTLKPAERSLLKDWIDAGAPDENGRPQL